MTIIVDHVNERHVLCWFPLIVFRTAGIPTSRRHSKVIVFCEVTYDVSYDVSFVELGMVADSAVG